MSTSPPPPAPMAPIPTGPVPPPSQVPAEIKVVSHSMLFYWWPVWFFGAIFALLTYIDNNRLVIVGSDAKIRFVQESGERRDVTVTGTMHEKRLMDDTAESKENLHERNPKIRVTARTWMGPVFFTIIFLVILITSVPLRGLWSLVTIILIALLAVIFSLFELWDNILKSLGDLHVFINMAGYLAISFALFIAWVVVIWVFDRRTYIIFTPGQVRVCEELGGREKVYDTTNMTMEKHRDDWFRHIILGFGTGDMSVKTSGAERHEILLPNVAFIGFKIDAIQQMLRSRQTSHNHG